MSGNLIDHGAARAIVEGRHGDPFSVLGLHKREGAWVVTAFVPGAERLWVLTGKAGKAAEADPSPTSPASAASPLTASWTPSASTCRTTS